MDVAGPDGPVRVNRYLPQNANAQALVLYWYQGLGRVESNEYVVKWDLLRDAVLRRRSDATLVRIVVPRKDDGDTAMETAADVARILISAVLGALPT